MRQVFCFRKWPQWNASSWSSSCENFRDTVLWGYYVLSPYDERAFTGHRRAIQLEAETSGKFAVFPVKFV